MDFPLILKAYANPFAGGLASMDREGRGHAYCTVLGNPLAVHGAVDNAAEAKRRGTRCLDFHGQEFDVGCGDWGHYLHYRQQFHDGVLVAADEETATVVGLKFVDAKEYIAACRDAACAAFKAEHGREPWASKANEAKRAGIAAKAKAEADKPAPSPAELPSPPLPPSPKPSPDAAPAAVSAPATTTLTASKGA